MIASMLGEGEAEIGDGIVSGYSYPVVSIHEVTHEGENERLIRLRNPWGSRDREGKWSKTWEGWTPELRSELGLDREIDDEEADGMFFIPYEDYYT